MFEEPEHIIRREIIFYILHIYHYTSVLLPHHCPFVFMIFVFGLAVRRLLISVIRVLFIYHGYSGIVWDHYLYAKY